MPSGGNPDGFSAVFSHGTGGGRGKWFLKSAYLWQMRSWRALSRFLQLSEQYHDVKQTIQIFLVGLLQMLHGRVSTGKVDGLKGVVIAGDMMRQLLGG